VSTAAMASQTAKETNGRRVEKRARRNIRDLFLGRSDSTLRAGGGDAIRGFHPPRLRNGCG
jgi:hypothetical protein